MPKKKVSRAIFRGGMAEAVALEDEQTDEQSTTTAPDGSQVLNLDRLIDTTENDFSFSFLDSSCACDSRG